MPAKPVPPLLPALLPAFLPAFLPALLLALLVAASPAAARTWLFESAQTLPGTGSSWGRITLDAASGRLFIARGDDGILVWDIKTRRATTIDNSKGANAVILVPDLTRAYAAMADGSALSIDLNTLKPIDRQPLDAGDLTDGFYEPTQKRVHLITGQRPEKTTWLTLDAATGKLLGKVDFNSRQMDTPATDEHGAIFAPQRDRGLLLQLDAKDLSIQKTWKLGDCTQPAAVTWDQASQRVLLGCRGEKPVFVALSLAAGVVASVPIGRGVGDIVFDAKRHLAVTANGIDGSLSVIDQATPDSYALVETIATRPMARDLQIDPETGRLYTVAATFTQPAPTADNKAPQPFYHPDSFTILTFRADTLAGAPR